MRWRARARARARERVCVCVCVCVVSRVHACQHYSPLPADLYLGCRVCYRWMCVGVQVSDSKECDRPGTIDRFECVCVCVCAMWERVRAVCVSDWVDASPVFYAGRFERPFLPLSMFNHLIRAINPLWRTARVGKYHPGLPRHRASAGGRGRGRRRRGASRIGGAAGGGGGRRQRRWSFHHESLGNASPGWVAAKKGARRAPRTGGGRLDGCLSGVMARMPSSTAHRPSVAPPPLPSFPLFPPSGPKRYSKGVQAKVLPPGRQHSQLLQGAGGHRPTWLYQGESWLGLRRGGGEKNNTAGAVPVPCLRGTAPPPLYLSHTHAHLNSITISD